VVVCVDLAVRVSDGRTDLGAAIFEHEHKIDVVALAERRGSLGPQVDDFAHAGYAQRRQSRIVMRRVQHDFTAVALHCRPAIGEPVNLVRIGCFKTADAERASGRWEIWSSLARPNDVHHRAQIWVDALVGGNGHWINQPTEVHDRGRPRPKLKRPLTPAD